MRHILICCLAAPLFGQPQGAFRFDDFRTATPLRLLSHARRESKVLRLTPAQGDSVGAAWFPDKQTIGGGFETEFQFQLTDQGGLGKGADGLAFVIQNSGPDAIAGRGSSGGFALGDGQGDPNAPGIARSIAVFFDTFKNDDGQDPSDNYIAICTNGKVGEMQWPPSRLAMAKKPGVKLKDRKVHWVRIVYAPPVMRVFLDNPRVPVLTSTVDFSTVLDTDASAWVGFTASTGGGWENHDVLNWSFGAKPMVSSNISIVSSNIAFLSAPCLPDRNLCTPERAIVEPLGPGEFHIVVPAHLDASIPNPSGRQAIVRNARGTVCWDVRCVGPDGALATRTRDGRTFFSVKDGKANEGFFEFDVTIQRDKQE